MPVASSSQELPEKYVNFPHLASSNSHLWINLSHKWGSFIQYGVVFVVLWLVLWFLSNISFLLFHITAETFTIVVGFSVFLLSFGSLRYASVGLLHLLGLSSLFCSILDLIHVFTYSGMNLIPDLNQLEVPTQLWIASRAIQMITALFSVFLLRPDSRLHRFFFPQGEGTHISISSYYITFASFFIVCGLVIASIVWWEVFPSCLTTEGLTDFKIVMEYIISFGFIVCCILFYLHREALKAKGHEVLGWLLGSFLFCVGSELCFTLYTHPTQDWNKIGHLFKFFSYLCLLRLTFKLCYQKPVQSLFSHLLHQKDELASLVKQLKEKNDSIMKFQAYISHEIRCPMNAVAGLTELLLQTSLTSDQSDMVSSMYRSSQHMIFLLNDMLDLAKLSAGKMEFMNQHFNLTQLLMQTTILFQPMAQKKQQTLTFSSPFAQHISSYCDSRRLQQVLSNLISNAVKYTPKFGSINVSVDIKVPKPDVSQDDVVIEMKSFDEEDFPSDAQVCISVSDTGVGIAPEFQSHVFEEFKQDHAAQQVTDVEGTGLGLAVVKQMVTQMNGFITVRNNVPDPGCTFSALFSGFQPKLIPVVLEPPPSDHSSAATVYPNSLKILVIDDSKVNRKVFSRLLALIGKDLNIEMNVELSTNGRDGLAVWEEARFSNDPAGKPFDFVFMDFVMPVMDGGVATTHIREKEEAVICKLKNDNPQIHVPTTPIIVITGLSPTEIEMQSKSSERRNSDIRNSSDDDVEDFKKDLKTEQLRPDFSLLFDAFLTKPVSRAKMQEMCAKFAVKTFKEPLSVLPRF